VECEFSNTVNEESENNRKIGKKERKKMLCGLKGKKTG